MRLATIRRGGSTAAVRIDGDNAIDLGVSDVGAVLRQTDWRSTAGSAAGRRYDVADLEYAPLVPRPPKIVCVGLNYRKHILEVGLPIPRYPTLFSKYPAALIGAADDIQLPPESPQMDWEAELAVVVGSAGRRLDESAAAAAIAGFTVANDISARDWQTRTEEWMQGKTFEATNPLGPHLVTSDEAGDAHEIVCEVDGEVMQRADTSDLVFGPAALVAYVSQILPLEPGDVILTGTPGGVGFARSPQRWLADGEVVTTRIGGIGECRNRCTRV